MSIFTSTQQATIDKAISHEIAIAKKQIKPLWLDIDAIEHVRQVPHGHVYRLLLSRPIHLQADQPLIFTLKGGATFSSVVISSSDEGIVIQSSEPLPEDAVVMNVSFDPSFILCRLREFFETCDPTKQSLAATVMEQRFPPLIKTPMAVGLPPKFNEDQCQAVADMEANSIHLLWGPPGTGKTTTLGGAVAGWLARKQSVLVVST